MKKWLLAALLFACKSNTTAENKGAAPAAPLPVLSVTESESPVVPLPKIPLGVQADFSKVAFKMTPEKVRLGRLLFFDKRLSKDETIACGSCHIPENAFSEPKPHSTGISGQLGTRKAPTFINGAWPLFPVFFWDGRANSLVEQAKGPIENPIEMGMTHDIVVARIAKIVGYKRLFFEVYGDDTINIDRLAEAIAAYEATRLSGNSAWDRFDAGDAKALTEGAQQGRELFFGKAQCNQCHFGWNFSDSQFHNLGIGWDAARAKGKRGVAAHIGFADIGRYKISKKIVDSGAFKTPTVREVSKHAPYMHDGSLATLKDVVHHYNKGGNPNPWLSKKVFKLNLTDREEDAIVAFLNSLEGEGYQDDIPKKFPQ